jgi:hypothetical protein
VTERHREDLSRRLRPVCPPRIVDDVLTDAQLAAVWNLMRRHGPWDLIVKHHFASLEELIATTSGGRPADSGASLMAFVTPTFRGFLASDGVCLFPEAEPILYDRKLMAWAREYWGARYVRPNKILFNVNGPCANLDPGHLDSPRFRGMGILNTPLWLLSVMAKSGLFQRWQIKQAEVITWFYRGAHGGGFTYWPDGPLAPPKRLSAPLWNRGVVVQNTAMYHRGEGCGPPDRRANPPGLGFDSTFSADPAGDDRWQVTTGDRVIARYASHELRLLVHWDAELYGDLADMKKHLEHQDDLAPDRVFEMLAADLRAKGVRHQPPADPMREPGFIELLARTYDVPPSAYPPDAPIASFAA